MSNLTSGSALTIKTTQYAGNFEREMCAYLTGMIGECGVGREYMEVLQNKPNFQNVKRVPDDNGCYRPVDCEGNNVVIYFEDRPTDEQIAWIKEYAPQFDQCRKTIDAEFYANSPVIEILGYRLGTVVQTFTQEDI